MSHFDERSGIVASPTAWGRWWQTMEDVTVEVGVHEGTLAKGVTCVIKTRHLTLCVNGNTLIDGDLWNAVQADESIWTLEDRRMVRICLMKADRTAANCWSSLLTDQYPADPLVLDNMKKNMVLQRFQFENPGMDFSNATLSGNYESGGPDLPT